MSPSSEMAWAYGDWSSWLAWDFPNVNTESPKSRKSPQSLAHQVSWLPKPSPWPAHPARLITLQFCFPYGIGDPAFHSLQASGLLADMVLTQGNAGKLKNSDTLLLFTSLSFSLWSEAVRRLLISGRNTSGILSLYHQEVRSTKLKHTFPSISLLTSSLGTDSAFCLGLVHFGISIAADMEKHSLLCSLPLSSGSSPTFFYMFLNLLIA